MGDIFHLLGMKLSLECITHFSRLTIFLALFIIMLGMGLGLTLDDFKRVLVEPKAVILGLIAQLNKSQI